MTTNLLSCIIMLMTRQEFESLIIKANLNDADNDELFAITAQAIASLETLKLYDGESNE